MNTPTSRLPIRRLPLGLLLSSLCLAPGLDLSRIHAQPSPQPPSPNSEEADLSLVAPWNGEILGTGTRRPDHEQWAWGEANLQRLEGIPISPLGLERVNARRAQIGKPPLPPGFFDTDSPGSRPESSVTAAPGAPGGSDTDTTGSLPSGIDNSTLKFFPPIRSQGSLNSCAQFSAVYYTLTHMTAMARNWDAKSGGDAFRFSPKWTYNMVNGGGNVGSWHYDAYAIAQKHGVATWAEFPYDSNYRAWCLNPTAWWNAIHVRADQAGKVTGIHGATGLEQLKQLLVNGYVLNVATYINSWVWRNAANDPGTPNDDTVAGKPCVTQVNGSSGGHSMTIVGYNDDLWVDLNSNGIVEASEKGALRIANSWGTGWNEAGYCWIAYQALRTRNPANTAEGLAWYDEATWVTARPSYTPRLIAEFNLTHAKRSQLGTTLGSSTSGQSTPTTSWSPNRILANAGGAYAFDGTTTPHAATFYLDFTDLAPMTAGAKRYFLGLRDSTAGDALTVSSYTLIDPIHGKALPATWVPSALDATQAYAYADYDLVAGALPPTAVITASATLGDLPLVVTFDASGSYDSDGSIASVSWNFGDGTSATGATVQHTYTQAGTFTAVATVSDNEGGSGTASIAIAAIDPNVLFAPSSLSLSAASRVVTLRWTDNSNNETGYSIERGIKSKSGISYAVVGTVGANTTSFSQTVPAGTHYYRVQAVNSFTGAVSPYSNAPSIRVR